MTLSVLGFVAIELYSSTVDLLQSLEMNVLSMVNSDSGTLTYI